MKDRILNYIKLWEKRCYNEGIPDEVPNDIKDLVPSYKKICIAILNNDNSLKSLGLTTKKSKYYSAYKKIEIENRFKKQKNESSKI